MLHDSLGRRRVPMQTHRNFFLEDHLRSSSSATSTSQPSTAAAILQSWAELRRGGSSSSAVLSALRTLSLSRSALHVSDPQASLLFSLLSSAPSPSLFPHLLSLLSTYLRKSSRPSPSLLLALFSSSSSLPAAPHSVLLLGLLSAASSLPDASRAACLDRLSALLEPENAGVLLSDETLVPEVLAGIGYALSQSDDDCFRRIFALFLAFWHANRGRSSTVSHGLMILYLVDWLASEFISLRSWSKVELLCNGVSAAKTGDDCRAAAPFAIVMAAAGLLRAFRSNRLQVDPRLRSAVEGSIGAVAQHHVISGMEESDYSLDFSDENRMLILGCIAMGLARAGSISFDAPVLHSLCLALLNLMFPLKPFFAMLLEAANGDSAGAVSSKVKEHLDSILFKEAGAVTGILCSQYAAAEEGSKTVVENHMWKYSQDLYSNLREVAFVHQGQNNDLLQNFEKIAEAAFLMVVVFASEVSKHKLDTKAPHVPRPEVAVRILVAFACIEYMRRVRLPEYTEAVRRAVLTIQHDAALSALFVDSMPSYVELTNAHGSIILGRVKYCWSLDEVQTARMLFYLRVIPTCISLIPSSMLGKNIVPKMFLYMQHPNEKVARASHSVFAALMSSSKDSDKDDTLVLKEQLVYYYMQRSLEVYPEITPFEGLASGVAALVRHVPAGSPAIMYCVHSLKEKTNDLYKKDITEDATMWMTWERTSMPSKKVLELLQRLISLVDIQVLPYLLKQLAELITQLPKEGQNVLLDQLYSQVAESDDVTRKPVLVSWLQSLSFLCSQTATDKKTSTEHGNAEIQIVSNADGLSLNRTKARL